MGALKNLIEQQLPGIYVHSLMIGTSVEDDQLNGFFMNVNEQIEFAWKQIQNDSNLSNGFNAVGFSQGGQFLRAYVQRHNNPPVYNLVSIGGQHQGVFGMPRCPGNNSAICEMVRKLLNIGVYEEFVQDHLVQAEYWQDPLNEQEYLNRSVFLADINNAHPVKNATYKANLQTLNLFSMTMFTLDTMVQPRLSEWFGWYQPGSDKLTVPLNQTALYEEDWLGLRVLDQQNKLQFVTCDTDHLQFTTQWFIDNIIPLLNNTM